MYHLSHNFSLREINTFRIPAFTQHYLTIESPEDFIDFTQKTPLKNYGKWLFFGGGSNLLFTDDFDGLIIHPQIKGIRLLKENKYIAEIEAGAGVTWDDLVAWCVGKGYGGIENLSLIPGNTGAVPVQNIGAYGVEVSSVISEVRGIAVDSLEKKCFNRDECKFGYRTSLFKEQLTGQFLITSVVFQLSRHPVFQLNYEGLESKVRQFGEMNLQNIRQAIIDIRESKLPNHEIVGNAGSFFKNPVVLQAFAKSLKELYPEIPLYPIGSGLVKVAAGWLIEKSGWKGKGTGKAAIHDQQALVIINNGGATGKEIFRFSELVAEDVLRKFNIELEREVQVIGKSV
jgi:UDP-N-acetylmuramate dehydrogenase